MQTLSAIKHLEGEGYDLSSVRAEWEKRNAAVAETMQSLDQMYLLPEVAPKIDDHLATKQILAPERMWGGYAYTLTRGQRKWLREVHGLSNLAPTVVIDWVQVWEGTRHPRSFKFTSQLHVDPKHKASLVITGVISTPGKFFFESAQFDTELSQAGSSDTPVKKGKGTVLPKKTRTLEEVMADLEKGIE